MRFATALLTLLTGLTLPAAALELPRNCRQAVVVTAPSWQSSGGTLQRWARAPAGGRWQAAGAPVAVRLGEKGLAWGIGLHATPPGAAPRKVEGDRRAPAGVFALTGAFGFAPRPVGRMPWQQVTASLEAIDDPKSRCYNQIVSRDHGRVDWKSSERMATIPDYRLGVVVGHNPQNVPGAGSCIFLHLWLGARTGTAGCTVLRERDLLELLHWLDPAAQPVLVQLPREATGPGSGGL